MNRYGLVFATMGWYSPRFGIMAGISLAAAPVNRGVRTLLLMESIPKPTDTAPIRRPAGDLHLWV